MRPSRPFLLIVCACLAPASALGSQASNLVRRSEPVADRGLSFEKRVDAQAAIERVYWSHRSWPEVNPGTRPSFEASMPRSVLVSRVEDAMKETSALESLWGQTLTARDLQAELDRMARDTRQPAVLRELFTSVGDDPYLVAETLARAALVGRLLESRYALDDRFHREVRAKAIQAIASAADLDSLEAIAPMVERKRWTRGGVPATPQEPQPGRSDLSLDDAEWSQLLASLEANAGAEPDGPTGGSGSFGQSVEHAETPQRVRVDDLREDADRFFVRAVTGRSSDAIDAIELSWPKRSFSDWWAAAKTGLPMAPGFARGGYRLPAIASASCTPDTWSPIAKTDPPIPRRGHTAVWTGKEMLIFGGSTDVGHDPDFGGRYDPASDSWRAMAKPAEFPATIEHAAVWTGSEMIVWGGSAFELNGGARYNPATDSWSPVNAGPDEPQRRRAPTAVWTGREMIVWGGHDEYGTPVGTGARYDPATDRWTPTSVGLGTPPPHDRHTAVWTGTEMIVWGGTRGPGNQSNIGGRYNPVTDSWKATATVGAPSGRTDHTAVWTGSEMIIWGGVSGGYRNNGGRYDPSSDRWQPTSTGPGVPSPRGSHTAVWTGREMIIWGGSDFSASGKVGGAYDPSTDSWRPTSVGPGTPELRGQHTAVWTGSEMIVWGGYTSTANGVSTGGRYDPATDRWLPTSMGPSMPSRRGSHASVWTGAEMIVWGGNPPQNFGSRYVPATDSWVAMSSGTGAPLPDYVVDAVWTGTEMIAWGAGFKNTGQAIGARYNPASDAWALLPTGSSAPALRSRPSIVWTGTEMIVWGGSMGGTNVNTGAKYAPASNTWTPTSTGSNVPSARYFHTAVWTGSEMIVWGGYRNGQLNSGARYNPASDSWQSMSLTSAVPAPRYIHSAVWTGSEMIVWGGAIPSEPYYATDGGRYDPRTDTWRSIAVDDGTPDGRLYQTAVWTGAEMVVWGGQRLHFPFNAETGGRYDPVADRWRATSLPPSGTIPGRYLHSAVWTGSEMLVWGGRAELETNTGGRYCSPVNHPPSADAGPDQVVECQGALSANVQLDGTASTDVDSTAGTNDDIASYEWSESGRPLSSGATPVVSLGLGDHPIELTVADKAGASGSDNVEVTVVDTQSPAGSVISPAGDACLGPTAVPVTLVDDVHDTCDPNPERSYDPGPGPSYESHGDHRVTLTATDRSHNALTATSSFTIDLVPPVVSLSSGFTGPGMSPGRLPSSLSFTSSDDDGAAGGVLHEVVKLAGCTILDGSTYGDADGLLSDEPIQLQPGDGCRIWRACGFDVLVNPELRVEATDCGGNVGFASSRLPGKITIRSGACDVAPRPLKPAGSLGTPARPRR